MLRQCVTKSIRSDEGGCFCFLIFYPLLVPNSAHIPHCPTLYEVLPSLDLGHLGCRELPSAPGTAPVLVFPWRLAAPPLHKDSVGTVLVRPHLLHPYLSPASWSLILLNHSLAVQIQLKHYLVLLYIIHRCRFSHQQTCLVTQNLGADSSPTVQTCRRQGGHNRLRCCFLWLSHVPAAMFLFRRHFLPLVTSETALRRIQNCSLGDFPILF